ncbi:putative DNA-binding protein [Oscillibacter valericigenes Sjm18-20]|nr:putative DNA-binding protein [Oscillibacter valericigenes Sjm18-20]
MEKTIGVNVTTVTRAYQEAEKRGLITATVGKGTFITSDLGRNPALINMDTGSNHLIEMGLALPLYSIEPDIEPLLNKVIADRNLRDFMKYTPPQGLYQHRQTGTEWIRQLGVDTDADHVIITAGTQHAFNCILSPVFEAGDKIAVDCITYPGFKTAARRLGIRLEAVLMDREGIIPESLEPVCSHGDIKGVYTVGRLQNPTNSIMSWQRREEIARIIQRHSLLLIEDDLYGFLSPQGTTPLSALLPDQSFYIAGTSKAFCSGLSISFLVSPARFYGRISQAVVDTVMMAPTLNAEIVCKCIFSSLAREIIEAKRNEIKRRANLMRSKLADYPQPDNLFAWLELPEDWSSSSLEAAAVRSGSSETRSIHVIPWDLGTSYNE